MPSLVEKNHVAYVYRIQVPIYFLAVSQVWLLGFRCHLHSWPRGHLHLKANSSMPNHSQAAKSPTSFLSSAISLKGLM